MTYIATFAILAAVLVIPVMIGARIVGAKNTGFGSALLAVIVLAGLSAAIGSSSSNEIVAFIAMAMIGAFVLAGILGTTFFRGLAVSLIATILQIVVILVFAASVAGVSA